MPVKKKTPRRAVKRLQKPKKTARKAVKAQARTLKKSAKLKVVPGRPPVKRRKPVVVGRISHYFPKVQAAVVELKGQLKLHERIRIKGHSTDFAQEVVSLQLDHTPLSIAKKGQVIGLQVESRVREGDELIKES